MRAGPAEQFHRDHALARAGSAFDQEDVLGGTARLLQRRGDALEDLPLFVDEVVRGPARQDLAERGLQHRGRQNSAVAQQLGGLRRAARVCRVEVFEEISPQLRWCPAGDHSRFGAGRVRGDPLEVLAGKQVQVRQSLQPVVAAAEQFEMLEQTDPVAVDLCCGVGLPFAVMGNPDLVRHTVYRLDLRPLFQLDCDEARRSRDRMRAREQDVDRCRGRSGDVRIQEVLDEHIDVPESAVAQYMGQLGDTVPP
jgi:hypothetical protein